MESQLWAIALKLTEDEMELRAKTELLATVSEFKVPSESLRVGTLDSLMSLSDDLVKLDLLAEGTTMKIYRQYLDLKGEEPTISGVTIAMYAMKQFEWDEAKFAMKTPLRELSESISGRIGGLDEELKLKVTEVNNLKGALQGAERKNQGNLMVRSLTGLIKAEDIMETEFMTTVFVVVPRHGYKEWNESYMTLAQYVVPMSAKVLSEDVEYGLFRVIVFKKTADDFKAAAREKRYTVREFVFEPTKAAEDEGKKEADTAEFNRLTGLLTKWCAINFAESYSMMLHLKAIRVFVESVLRYGLKSHFSKGMIPNFKAFIIQPKRGKGDALRKLLASIYGGSSALLEGDDAESAVPGAGGEFFPYVSVSVDTAPQLL